jgi:hypothetical protein
MSPTPISEPASEVSDRVQGYWGSTDMAKRGAVRRASLVASIVALGFATAATSSASEYEHSVLAGTYQTIMYPGSLQSSVRYIGPTGALAGQYQATNGSWHGFTKIRGVWRSVTFPKGTDTFVADIGPHGELLGGYVGRDHFDHGFTELKGRFTSFFDSDGQGTHVSSGNALGAVAGTDNCSCEEPYGFVYRAHKFTVVGYPMGAPGENFATGIDNSGVTVGWEDGPDNGGHERAWEGSGSRYATINDPEQPIDGTTTPNGMSPNGEIVGVWAPVTAPGTGAYVQIGNRYWDMPPGPGGALTIEPMYANWFGVVVGFILSSNVESGFEFVPS